MKKDPFALPPVSPKTTRAITAALACIEREQAAQRDPRAILKTLAKECGGTIAYPGGATAIRVAGLHSEANSSCGLHTAKLLVKSITAKAQAYLSGNDPDQLDMFGGVR